MMVENVEFVIANFDYTSREPHELTIRKNEKLQLISDRHNWYKVVNDQGQVGFVPSNFVRKLTFAEKAKETFKAFGRSRSKNSLDISEPQLDFPKLNVNDSALPNSILKKTNPSAGIKLVPNEMTDVVAYAVAKFNYEPQREDELRLTKGDHLSILDKSADGWWRVLTESGSSGWIPSNYVDETNAAPPSKTAASAPAPNIPTNGSSQIPQQPYNYNNGMSNFSSTQINNFPSAAASTVNSRVLEVVVALYSFDAQSPEELSFRKGEQLDVVDHPQHDPDWYKARNANGEIGLIPTNYIEIVDRNPGGGFATTSTTFPNAAPLTGPYALEPWYVGQLSREQSDALLNARGIEGDFLVRDSESNPGDYSISLKGNIRNKHFWVQITGGSYKIGNRTFTSMQQLIQHYTKSPIFSNDSTAERLYLVRPLPK